MLGIQFINLFLRSYIGLIRLCFDAVYQECKYDEDDINKETGEIQD